MPGPILSTKITTENKTLNIPILMDLTFLQGKAESKEEN